MQKLDLREVASQYTMNVTAVTKNQLETAEDTEVSIICEISQIFHFKKITFYSQFSCIEFGVPQVEGSVLGLVLINISK